ncbi:caveolin-2 isoform X2 [Clupea harengus]|nr:caveolin-2 isoform X2 [Clupea harengus]XP_031421539.1 caveolin-2 isoform X2 [Clupea harengus]
MMSDEYLVECNIDDDDDDDDDDGGDDDEGMRLYPSPPPPPPAQFSSSPSASPQPSFTHIDIRDPYGVNKHLKVEFSDILAEPISTHTYDGVWVYSGIGFESARIWGYRCLTLLCAVPVSLLSGCLFALLACLHIWCVMPCIEVCHICLPCVRSIWMSVVNIFITPFCESVSRCCTGVYVSLSKD